MLCCPGLRRAVLCWDVLVWAGLCWTVLDCAGLGCPGLSCVVLGCPGHCCAGLCWAVLGCAGLGCPGLSCVVLGCAGCPGRCRRSRLWRGCSNGPFTGRIRLADLHLGLCPENTVVRGGLTVPCRLAERSQYYHCTALTLSPPISSPLSPAAFASLAVLAPAWFLFSSSCTLPLLQPHRLASGGEKCLLLLAVCHPNQL